MAEVEVSLAEAFPHLNLQDDDELTIMIPATSIVNFTTPTSQGGICVLSAGQNGANVGVVKPNGRIASVYADGATREIKIIEKDAEEQHYHVILVKEEGIFVGNKKVGMDPFSYNLDKKQ